ncbi:MAG: methylmalonyl Co-A mutase-associated GTPase MeaB [Anaerolineae bacterium]|nr:methylmalonyl Co-A mutase-associated GTPase MeaB [Anaerolineae bacterium]
MCLSCSAASFPTPTFPRSRRWASAASSAPAPTPTRSSRISVRWWRVPDPTDLVQSLRANRRQLSRLLTKTENGQAAAEIAAIYPHTGQAHIIGVTGAPGTGKSTLVNALTKYYRQQGRTVAIVAVDPTSPFTGGAILGDRIRMRDLSGDPGVFVRSMATRGSLGGLARATGDLVTVFDAAGFDVILIETVGAGQSEVDVARLAHTTLVIEAPGLGDDVQAIKAGILEIADILVVNKADHPGVDNTVRALRAMLDLGHRVERVNHHGTLRTVPAVPLPDEATAWQPPILQTVAAEDKGIVELAEKIAAHRQYLRQTGVLSVREQIRIELELADRLREALLQRLLATADPAAIQAVIAQVSQRRLSLSEAVSRLLDHTSSLP